MYRSSKIAHEESEQVECIHEPYIYISAYRKYLEVGSLCMSPSAINLFLSSFGKSECVSGHRFADMIRRHDWIEDFPKSSVCIRYEIIISDYIIFLSRHLDFPIRARLPSFSSSPIWTLLQFRQVIYYTLLPSRGIFNREGRAHHQ